MLLQLCTQALPCSAWVCCVPGPGLLVAAPTSSTQCSHVMVLPFPLKAWDHGFPQCALLLGCPHVQSVEALHQQRCLVLFWKHWSFPSSLLCRTSVVSLINSGWTPVLCRSLTNLRLHYGTRQIDGDTFYFRPIPNQNLGLFLVNFLTNLWLPVPAHTG